jgi:hypothetical protein
LTNSADSPSKAKANLQARLDANPAVRAALLTYLQDLLDRAQADAATVTDIVMLRRAQGRAQEVKKIQRDVRSDAKTDP